MDQLDQIVSTISMTMGAAWGSGINLYATILVFGLLGITENIVLPDNLQILMNPMVIGAAGVMFLVEFIVDKIPGIDTGWDTFHTFIRIPAGALMAAGAVGDVNPAVALTAAILGGGMAAGAHATKSGSRIIINASPEPFTNWTASVLEDVVVIGGLWTALHYPWLFIVLLIIFILLMIWMLPKLWQGIKKVFGFIGHLFGFGKTDETGSDTQQSDTITDFAKDGYVIDKKIEKLNDLLQKNLITQEEYQKKKAEFLETL